MGKEKAGFLTPKAISNRIKAKGLQKLRWYCQMCQKQCRDANGFKCHVTSESHQRQLLLFGENPNRYVTDFSREFTMGFMDCLRHGSASKRVLANKIYQEYIKDRDHVHMNATHWSSLAGFVRYLGKTGRCHIEETEKGWYITYIDKNPETIKRQEAMKNKQKMELDDTDRANKFIEEQVQRAAAQLKQKTDVVYTELQRDEEEKVVINLGAPATAKPVASTATVPPPALRPAKKKSALDQIMESEEMIKETNNRKDNWLHEGIVVKVITKKLGDKYKGKKGVIREVIGKFGAVVKMLDSGDKIKVDQEHLETVIPGIGKIVLIVNGGYRNLKASLVEVNQKKFSCTVKISRGPLNGRILEGVPYEDLSKLHSS
ncbi:hypothetical protein CAPTEDRAFT_224242 [Capitella teleta]|uniref:DNA/RNA-binding protein Kin17 WH-like domain-containing protein n=1 Tax=Capitella teleta TaxID=283909 RepID=R7UZX8_CAPTE|nr:hypothetical protein CAPTEDRAFT_224242 [Capitella teleta]|eukprot:ELU12133.1 hypothetical protein CAPTEDRAFT_224242 [Capitella teleta]